MSNFKRLGSIWLITATYLLNTVKTPSYLIFMDKYGQLLTVEKEEDAPKDAHYVCTASGATKPETVAARLEFVALRHCG